MHFYCILSFYPCLFTGNYTIITLFIESMDFWSHFGCISTTSPLRSTSALDHRYFHCYSSSYMKAINQFICQHKLLPRLSSEVYALIKNLKKKLVSSSVIPTRITTGESNYYSRTDLKFRFANFNNLTYVSCRDDEQMIPVRITFHDQYSREITPVVNANNFSMPTRSIAPEFKRNSMELCLLNSRSVRNKTLLINDFVNDCNIDIMAITETWLNSAGDEASIAELCPEGFQFIHSPRENNMRGGGACWPSLQGQSSN